MNNDSNPFVRIFLSYRRDDVPDAVDRIADRLRERFGTQSVFVDIVSIDAGKKWRDVLTSALDKCDALLIVIGSRWLRKAKGSKEFALNNPDDLVRKEITTALSRDISIIPILWGDAKFPSKEALPPEVRGMTEYQAFSIRRERFESDMHLLLERVEAQVRMFASLGRRLGAFIIDLFPALAITSATGGNFWMFWGLLVVYHWLLVGAFGRTLGKLLMGTRVESSQPPLERWIFALARPIFGYPIMVFSGIGAIQLILHPQHVAIHDRLFHTHVLQTRRLPWAAGLGRIDGISYSFDEWLFKLLAGAGLGSLMQWAESFFGIDQPVNWVRKIFGRFRGGATSGIHSGVGAVGVVGTLLVVAPPLIVGFLLTALIGLVAGGATYSAVAAPAPTNLPPIPTSLPFTPTTPSVSSISPTATLLPLTNLDWSDYEKSFSSMPIITTQG